MENKFIKAAENATFTENGAISNKSTLSEIVDQFGKAGSFRGRSISAVFEDQAKLWDENHDYAVKFPFYLRAITRKTTVSGRSEAFAQVGQGARDESFKRILWFAYEQKDVFERNIWLLPFVGSWKDPWQLIPSELDIAVLFKPLHIIFNQVVSLDEISACQQCECFAWNLIPIDVVETSCAYEFLELMCSSTCLEVVVLLI